MAGDDALGLFQSLRPTLPATSPDIRAAARSGASGAPDLHSLAMVPGTPGYNARIPRPPCYQCGEDHVPNMQYTHAWMPEPAAAVHDEPVSASAIMRRPAVTVAPVVSDVPSSASPRRVALYVGRGDTYVVSVEEPPDWDAVTTFKVGSDLVLPLIQMARALEVKVQDKTGGDLLMLEQEAEDARRQPAQDHVRDTARPGVDRPRRQGPGADGPAEDLSGEDQAKAS